MLVFGVSKKVGRRNGRCNEACVGVMRIRGRVRAGDMWILILRGEEDEEGDAEE